MGCFSLSIQPILLYFRHLHPLLCSFRKGWGKMKNWQQSENDCSKLTCPSQFLEYLRSFAVNASLLLGITAVKRVRSFWRTVFCMELSKKQNQCKPGLQPLYFLEATRFLSTVNFQRLAKIFISQIKKNTDAYSLTKNIFQIIAI